MNIFQFVITHSRSQRAKSALIGCLLTMACSAMAAPALQTDFDALNEGPIGGQDGWTAPNDMARVLSEGAGKVLQLNAPYGNASHRFAAAGNVVITEFSIRFAKPTGGEQAKILISLDDAAKKTALLFFRDTNGQWGIKNGNNWNFSQSQPAGDAWRKIRITTDTAKKKNKVEIQDAMGSGWIPLFQDAAFSTSDAGAIATLTLARNGQGDAGAILVDQLRVSGPEDQAVTAAPAAAPITAPLVEDFDRMTETGINGQNGWTSKQGATIQTLFNANGGGKALDLAFPYGDAAKVFAPQGIAGQATLDFKIYLPEDQGDKKPKFLLNLKSAAGKSVALFFHDDNANWGLQTGNGWRFAPDKTKPGTWLPVRITMDLKGNALSVLVGQGKDWKSLFKDEPLVDPAATDIASLQLQRNGQGAPVSVYFDDLSLSPGILNTPQKVETSSLSAVTPGKEGYSIFQNNEPAEVLFTVQKKAEDPADAIAWELRDWQDHVVRSGKLDLPAGAANQQKLTFDALPAGYYALHAQRASNGDTLLAMGSRPRGIISFGVLPKIAPLPLASGDDARFGMFGTVFIRSGQRLIGDPFDPIYDLLGIHWVEVNRSWSRHEPNREGEYQPRVADPAGSEPSYRAQHQLGTLVAITGIPNWAADWPAGVTPPAKESMLNHAYPPKDMTQYATYLKKIAKEQYESRKAHFPYMKHGYYMIHHEADWHWKGTDAQFIAMYKTAHEALHAGDPDAVLLGPRYGVLAKGVTELERLLPEGLGEHLDGIATHMYYLPPRLTVTPEQAGNIENFRRLKALTEKYLKPGAPIAQLEWGVRYVESYDDTTPAVLRQHASQFVRGHIMALGEGCALTFLFYASDYTGEPGYGITYNLTMPDPDFGAISTSPKPTAMAVAAMTRLLDGTSTIGPVATNHDVIAYAFKRGNETVTAMWAPHADKTPVQAEWTTRDAAPRFYDTMGNLRALNITGGKIRIPLTLEPCYIVTNSPIAAAEKSER